MTQAEKLLQRMRGNPRDWTIADLKSVAGRHGIDWRQPGTSHVTFSRDGYPPVTVPAHKPIKPIYIRYFLELIDRIRQEEADHD